MIWRPSRSTYITSVWDNTSLICVNKAVYCLILPIVLRGCRRFDPVSWYWGLELSPLVGNIHDNSFSSQVDNRLQIYRLTSCVWNNDIFSDRNENIELSLLHLVYLIYTQKHERVFKQALHTMSYNTNT